MARAANEGRCGMSAGLLEGQLVRLTAENPDVMAKHFQEWNLDTEYFRMLDSDPPRLFSAKKWKEWLEKDLDKDPRSDFFFAIREITGSKIIGFTGLFDLYWHHGDSLLVIAIGERTNWGKGFGTDALKTLQRYVFKELNLRRLTLIVFEYNQRARRAYEKAGFVVEGRIRGAILRHGQRWDWLIMGVLREDWQKMQAEQQ
jgi:RimJ/RimL family protein N-acetyltransferase